MGSAVKDISKRLEFFKHCIWIFFLHGRQPHLLPQSLPSKQALQKQKKPSAGRVGTLVSLCCVSRCCIFSREFWTFHDIPGSFASEWSLNMTEQFQLLVVFFKGITFTHAVTVVRVQYSTVCMSVLKLSNGCFVVHVSGSPRKS